MSPLDFDNIVPTVIYFVDRKSTPSWCIIKDRIDFHDLTYITEGKVAYHINGAEYIVEAGDMIYIPRGNTREANTIKDTDFHSYAFNFSCSSSVNTDILLPFPTIFKIGKVDEVIDLCKSFNLVWAEKSPGFQLKARALFMLILHKYMTLSYNASSKLEQDSRISVLKEYIINNYDKRLELNELAKLVRLHPVYLGALFKKCSGCSIKEYITKIRINAADSLLSTEGLTVGETAERCGFEDIYYFSKVYKKFKGYPPSHSIKSLRS